MANGSAVAKFDSASALFQGLARCLRGQPFARLGMPPPTAALRAVNALPERAREQLYIWSGWYEALPPRRLLRVRSDAIADWVVSRYPDRPFPGVAVGSSNGAVAHLCAALGIPWLPQTFLLAVRHGGIDRDEPRRALAELRDLGRGLLAANPALQLHHMHDPNQDVLMVRRMAYFRVKFIRLPPAYGGLIERVPPGGTILVVDCRKRWPVTSLGPRHVFQFGAPGGAPAAEYYDGGPRVEAFLRRYGSKRRRWDAPEPDRDAPEAEWGFEEDLLDDVARVAERSGLVVRRLSFDEPEHVSPAVADVYRRWLSSGHGSPSRLLVGSFVLQDPYRTLLTRSVPFWTKFPVEPDADWLERYLDQREGFDEIAMMLFSHGADSIGLAGPERWREILARARARGYFVGVDEDAFPRDFGTFFRYSRELGRLPVAHEPLPPPPAVEDFLAAAAASSA
jgi:hypothetical protein